ncbi:hypothetical protein TYRP_003592 [Tyrophagus putrescentiae]|nr:hypothetical protein TYRP_003592 [Tyrophagus putrescentiae]
MPKRCCSSESRIKAIFFIHFTLFFFFLALNFTGEGRSQLMYLFSGTFLLVALFAALCSKSRAHHLAHLAGLIDLAAVLLDVLLFWPQLTSPEYLIKPYWTPFFLNLLLRLPFAFILLRITASVGNSEENGLQKELYSSRTCTAEEQEKSS